MLLALMMLLGASEVHVYKKADIDSVAEKRCQVFGTLRKTNAGTVLVLDDGTTLVLTVDDPPSQWAALVGKFIVVTGSIKGDRVTEATQPAPAARDLAKLFGQKVELHGIAQNAKGGAVLLVDGTPIYLRGRASWPDAKLGKEATVKGALVSTKMIPSPEHGPRGEISQGAEGNQWVLESPKD